MPTLKQQIVEQKLSENLGKPLGKIMLEAGYSPSTSKTPKNLTNSKAWLEMMEKKLPDKKLLKRHNELLDKKEVVIIRDKDDAHFELTDQPDATAVARGLDMAYKLKNKYPAERSGGDMNIAVVNVIKFGQDKKKPIEAEIVPNVAK